MDDAAAASGGAAAGIGNLDTGKTTMLRNGLFLVAWLALAGGVMAMLFGGEQGGLAGMGPWSAMGAAMIGLGVCVNAARQAVATEE